MPQIVQSYGKTPCPETFIKVTPDLDFHRTGQENGTWVSDSSNAPHISHFMQKLGILLARFTLVASVCMPNFQPKSLILGGTSSPKIVSQILLRPPPPPTSRQAFQASQSPCHMVSRSYCKLTSGIKMPYKLIIWP